MSYRPSDKSHGTFRFPIRFKYLSGFCSEKNSRKKKLIKLFHPEQKSFSTSLFHSFTLSGGSTVQTNSFLVKQYKLKFVIVSPIHYTHTDIRFGWMYNLRFASEITNALGKKKTGE
jgi:hypothetical protein